ncbi:hypothetical protein H6G89_32570 [Oscillatoria sp. FACHB-1407]|uniref:hypothetical protein n=1 Tax=Oscillatoria sp. FACHB-1407 TaxID=2692847 RepID=UPI00168698C3|nr:hypothetical protein [Oscillatoria sp. FACHB-1407]MBD2465724.1 hypothetical protein [Oscillatoria sp. FACHB-1407]
MTNLNSGSGLLNLNGLGMAGGSNLNVGDRNLNLQEWANTLTGATVNMNLGSGNLNLPAPTASPSPSPTPTPISPAGLPLPESWIDVSQETAIADGLPMVTLTERSPAERSFTSAMPGTYRTNQRNGLPVLRTTPLTTAYLASTAPVIASGSPFCLWFVGRSDGADAIVWGNQLPNHQVRINYTGNRTLFLYNGPSVTSDGLTGAEATAWNIYLFVRNTANEVRFYLNGVPKFSVVGNNAGAFNLGRLLESFSTPFVGDFAEAGYNAADFSTAQLNSLGMYLSVKWAIAWTPIP